MVTAFVTIFVVALLFVIGLVLDGGYLLAAQREAANVAAQAARAGAQELDVSAFRADSSKDVIDVPRAEAAAQAFLAQVGREGTARATADEVTVTVTIRRKMLILPLAEQEVHGTGSAHGVQGE
jgi:Flp pilus assembly protein TadG